MTTLEATIELLCDLLSMVFYILVYQSNQYVQSLHIYICVAEIQKLDEGT